MVTCRHILIVDDEPDLRDTLQEFLQLMGFGVSIASNGEEALDSLATARPCLILLDLMMPVMDGWQFLDRFRELYGKEAIPIIVISAAADLTDLERQYGCKVMSKPVALGHLAELAGQYCADQRLSQATASAMPS